MIRQNAILPTDPKAASREFGVLWRELAKDVNSLILSVSALETTLAAISPIQSIQTGYAPVTVGSSGSGEDTMYKDITITAVDTAKSVVLIQPSVDAGDNYAPLITSARLTSTTNLRLSKGSGTSTYVSGRWTVIEYK